MAPPSVKKPPEEVAELEDVVMEGDGKGNFRVAVIKVKGPVVSRKVLEEKVSLLVARGAAASWRARNGGLNRGLK